MHSRVAEENCVEHADDLGRPAENGHRVMRRVHYVHAQSPCEQRKRELFPQESQRAKLVARGETDHSSSRNESSYMIAVVSLADDRQLDISPAEFWQHAFDVASDASSVHRHC